MMWRPIPGYENFYEISEDGRVKRLSRLFDDTGPIYRRLKEKILSYGSCRGYLSVTLTMPGASPRTFTVHRLVARAFIGDGNGFVLHCDGNMKNNHFSNLRYGSAKDNADDRESHGRTARGMSIGNGFWTEEKVILVRSLYACGASGADIARMFNVSRARIFELTSRKTWKHV